MRRKLSSQTRYPSANGSLLEGSGGVRESGSNRRHHSLLKLQNAGAARGKVRARNCNDLAL